MKRVRGWLILGAVVVLLFVFMKPIERYSDALIHAPWAYGWDSRGDLTDDWTAVLPDGRSLDLTLARETGTDGLPTPADDSDAQLVGSQIHLKLFQAETVVGQLRRYLVWRNVRSIWHILRATLAGHAQTVLFFTTREITNLSITWQQNGTGIMMVQV